MAETQTISINPSQRKSPLRTKSTTSTTLPNPQKIEVHPTKPGDENASLFFVGTATTILEWRGIRLMTDPNFLHAGDHVHLGPGVTTKRVTNPAIDLEDLPPIDVVLLSHYHADHFDQEVEEKLRRDLPIVTTPHARECLVDKKDDREKFTSVTALDFWESCMILPTDGGDEDDKKVGDKVPAMRVRGMPGKHVPPGLMNTANELLGLVPPTNGWMLELGYLSSRNDLDSYECGYRIYISGDTLLIDELKQIPERYKDQAIDLMLIHLGGTTIPSPSIPLLMVTMDATQGVQLMQLVKPDVTIPIHYDDYEAFLSPLSDFKKALEEAGLGDKVVYLDRKDQYRFAVQQK